MDDKRGTPEGDGSGGEPAPPGTPTPAENEQPPGPRRPRRWWSRTLVAAAAALIAAVVGTHLMMTFLFNAPTNTISAGHTRQIDGWMLPLFNQNWHLFAPDPYSENVDIAVRGRLTDGTVSGWVDLSAQDQAAEHNPVPGHITVNALRNAYTDWASTHSEDGGTTSALGPLAQEYLENLVVDRAEGSVGKSIGAIQLRITTALIPGPGRTARQTAPRVQTLDWWVVS